jgi:4-amino-4-deoxy-L-arabinose transferase-like glycosyltransferase
MPDRNGAGAPLARAHDRGAWSTRDRLTLVAIMTVALGLRVYHASNHTFTGDDRSNLAIADTISLNPFHPHLVFASAGHPLLVVYLAHLGSAIFGGSVLGYRLPLVLLGTLTCWAIAVLGREIGGRQAGLWAAALIAVDQFHVTGSGTVHVHDIPLILFGTLALVSMCRVTPDASIRPFVGVGFWMGLAYLGKETALMVWPALWLFLLTVRERRSVLLDWRWYVAHLVFALVIAPDLVWNVLHAADAGYLDRSLGKAAAATGGYGKAVSLFLGEVVMFFKPEAYGGHDDYWCWPLRTMHWVAGALYLAAVAWSWRWRRDSRVWLLLLTFGVVFLIVTMIKGKDVWDPFWWAAMAMAPAVALAGLCIANSIAHTRRMVWVWIPMVAWLLFHTIMTLRAVPFRVEDCWLPS